jgi:hypothetical protein
MENLNAHTSQAMLALASTATLYARSPANDVAAGERTTVDAVAWEKLGGSIHYYPYGLDPNAVPDAQRLDVAREWYW